MELQLSDNWTRSAIAWNNQKVKKIKAFLRDEKLSMLHLNSRRKVKFRIKLYSTLFQLCLVEGEKMKK